MVKRIVARVRHFLPVVLAALVAAMVPVAAYAQTEPTVSEIITEATGAMTSVVGQTVLVIVILAGVTLALAWRFLGRLARVGR